jgi:hypothetical protein
MVIGTFNAHHVDSNHTAPLQITTVLDGQKLNKAQAPSTTLESVGVQPQKQCSAKDQPAEQHSSQPTSEKMDESAPTSDSKAKLVAKAADLETHRAADCLSVDYHEKLEPKNSEPSLPNTVT